MTLLQTPSAHSAPVSGFPNLGRIAGASWFLVLAAMCGKVLFGMMVNLPGRPLAFAQWAPILSSACTLVFYLTLAWLIIVRPEATARRTGLGPRVVSLLGTYGVWTVGFLPHTTLSPTLSIVTATVTLVGGVLIVFTIIHLGRSFSIAPQARALVTRGPYALVRHPLYAAEEIALIGVAMHVVWWAAAPVLVVHLALQIQRMRYEERLLSSVFPDYADYARRTARLIPGVW